MENRCTLVTMLKTAAEKSVSSNKGIIFHNNSDEKKVTYKDLMKESLRVAGSIIDAGVEKESYVVLQLKDPELFIKGFWGAVVCGAIPVPLTVDDKKGLDIKKLTNITNNLNNYIILTEPCFYDKMKDLFQDKDKIYSIENLSGTPLKNVIDTSDDEKTAYIQFSSGSTSNPKGVCLTHRNIASNIKGLTKRIGLNEFDQDDVILNWVPLTHNMGLVGFHIMPIFQCSDQHILSPAYLVQNTEYVLGLIKTKKINTFACPNFIMKILLSKLNDDLMKNLDFSNVKSIHLGAEPINPSLVRQFTNRLKSCGLNEKAIACSYGLAESTMLISHQYKNEGLLTIWHEGKEIVLNGTPLDGTTVYTVDEQGHIQENGIPGELVVKSASVMQGYLGIEPEADFKETGLKTGDIGIVMPEGIVVFGRMKDMIIINAKNFYTTDIELEIEKNTKISSEAFVITSALDSNSNENIKLYLLREIYEKFPGCAKAAEAVFESYTGSRLSEIFIVNEIPRTASGKKQRFQMQNITDKERVEEGKETEKIPPSSPLELKIAAIWEAVLNVKVNDIYTSFFKMGGDSLTAMDCIVQLKKENIDISPEYFYADPTVGSLVRQLEHGSIAILAEQEVMAGETVPLPSHYKLLADKFLYQWNFGILLDIEPLPSKELLKDIMKSLLIQQDGLRHRFRLKKDTLSEWIAAVDDCILVDQINYTSDEELKYYIECFQGTLDLETCPFKFVTFQQIGENSTKLMLILHHALGDAYSIGLLMDDFLEIYDVLAVQKKHYVPRKKATSLRQWEQIVHTFAQSEACTEDLSYWRNVCSANVELPYDFVKENENNIMIYEKIHYFPLLPKNGTNYKEDLHFKLLAAWFLTLSQWSGQDQVDVMYTQNGRSGITSDIPYDLSSTIGWFAFLVPVKFLVTRHASPIEMTKQVKQQINSIPHGGISYGCLKYMRKDKIINSYHLPQSSFNFYNLKTGEESYQKMGHRIAPSKETIEVLEHPRKNREHIIDLVIVKTERNELHAKLHYSCKIHKEETIQSLAKSFEENTRLFIDD